MSKVIDGIDSLKDAIGEHLGFSGWHQITQSQIDGFAEATGDHQWIHVDREAAATGPFGTTIAHGYLTLSLIPKLLPEVVTVENVGMAVNYGANRIRFPSPVLCNSYIRVGAVVSGLEEIPGGVQILMDATVEIQGSPKPALVAQLLYRYYF